jgi:hypothetical protein
MPARYYRGYRLVPERGGIIIYYGRERIETVDSIVIAEAHIDSWVEADDGR